MKLVAVSNFREELVEVEHLDGGTLADVVHVLLVGEAVEAHAAVVGDARLQSGLKQLVQSVLPLVENRRSSERKAMLASALPSRDGGRRSQHQMYVSFR